MFSNTGHFGINAEYGNLYNNKGSALVFLLKVHICQISRMLRIMLV